MKTASTSPLRCPECREPAASEDLRVCPDHRLYLLTAPALAKLDEAPLLGQVLDGKYALVDLLGGGGYGSVYRALQQPLGRDVAVKVLHGLALTLKIGRERFEREAQALARLTSSHTVRLIDYGITREGQLGVRNLPYMVMELIEGEDLERRLKRGTLTAEELLEVLEALADSLGEAHAHGIIHRDLKPSNVILARSRNGRSLPKVIDFGIARVEGSNQSQTGFVTGTPAYMAPEQARGEADLDARVDVYALAAMTFELVAGRPPYLANDAVAVLNLHCNAEIPSLGETRVERRFLALDSILRRGLAKDKSQRPDSIVAFVDECRAALRNMAPSSQDSLRSTSHQDAEGELSEIATDSALRSSTALYSSGSGAESMKPSDAPTQLPFEPATALHMATPMTISSLPGVIEGPSPAVDPSNRLRGRLAGIALGAVGAVLVGWFIFGGEQTTTAASAVAMPASAAVVVPHLASDAASTPPQPLAITSAAVVAPTRAREPEVLAQRLSPEPDRPKRREARSAVRDLDPAAQSVASEVDRALDECRCTQASKLNTKLEAMTGALALAASRKARVAACRQVDVDHRCVGGRLVEIE